ncbi:hypothetical protein COCMIDRAFT_28666 [Bipolaris oryzae ATCC 44560]|uniref:Uncharacterized protein n=1 Tax=Bipolaris oryzae ATCC 44560 TaxID=930090 RepID=W6YTH2_COCMI|nr:uncharacterized protein COCMIDRAFT_28666 [Bipolaris oryzae ATCC 44560]EUC42752.1 hypothetical protein COCMIDRAFT_28666 [Bipolaris oryzae ATCC 44560]
MADEQGGMRGVKRLMVEAGGGAIIGQMRCGSSKEPAVRGGRDATGLGNACTACCGVLLSMPPSAGGEGTRWWLVVVVMVTVVVVVVAGIGHGHGTWSSGGGPRVVAVRPGFVGQR